jgi:predicted PurR-regulated permease PerM
VPLLRQELWNVRYSGHKRFDFFLLPDIQEREANIIMMNGMMGMGAGMLIWGIVGILLIVLLVTLIAKVLKR